MHPKPTKPLSKEEKIAAIRAMIAHLRLALDDLERVLTNSHDLSTQSITAPDREILKPSEYADRMRVSVGKVHGWIKKGMPHFEIEGRVRIRVKEADPWVAARKKPQSEKPA